MPAVVPITLRDYMHRRIQAIPLGFSWVFVATTCICTLLIVAVSVWQRAEQNLGAALAAAVIATSSEVVFFVIGNKAHASVLAFTVLAATGLFLFAEPGAVTNDYAPLLLVVMTGIVGALSPPLGGVLAAAASAALLTGAAATGHLDGLALYLPVLGMGWLVGFLMHIQQNLLIGQRAAQVALTEHAAADERRRIAREVHDVIAHSLSITLLHVTGARRGLQQDQDIDDAVDALKDAEQLGRQAMADIRRTVGLLDRAPMKAEPEPGVEDIATLVKDFVAAGLTVDYRAAGPTDRVSPGVGLALYRVTQESLANIAKHAPDSRAGVHLTVLRWSVRLRVTNELSHPAVAGSGDGRGLAGMRQRVELLGGAMTAGPCAKGWVVQADIPLEDPGRLTPWCGG